MVREYEIKRKFTSTPEPKFEAVNNQKEMTFVIQQHAASHLHYDFRIQFKGVLISWAIPKGLPKEKNQKHLAVHTEDHPVEYKNFEGIIPEGNYGAGTVMVWDRGVYQFIKEDKFLSANEIERALNKGHFNILLDGKKIKGIYSFVRTKDKDWLVINRNSKGQPGPGRDMSVLSGRTMSEIKTNLDKDIESNLQKLPDETMPLFIKPMLATLIDNSFSDENWIFEIKWDGYRAISYKKDRNIRILSRNNQLLNRDYPKLEIELLSINLDYVLDGEIVVLDQNGKPDFSLIQKYKQQKMGKLVYYVFDLLFRDKKDLRDLPLITRKELLNKLINPNFSYIKISDFINSEGESFFEEIKKNNLEGMIAKEKNSIYESGKRSRKWLKIKTSLEQEAVIAGYVPKNGNFKSLILGANIGKNLTYIGNVGTGFAESDILDLMQRLVRKITSENPFKKEIGLKNTVWVKPELVCRVKFQEWTSDGLMRQPIFLGLKSEIDPKTVSKEVPEHYDH